MSDEVKAHRLHTARVDGRELCTGRDRYRSTARRRDNGRHFLAIASVKHRPVVGAADNPPARSRCGSRRENRARDELPERRRAAVAAAIGAY